MRVSLYALAALASAVAAVDGANFCDLIRCSSKVEPVCATNGVSFDNACMFQIAKCHNDSLAIAATGRCAAAVTEKPAADAAVANATVAPSANATVAPAPAAVCEMMCLDMVEPVCGSDGKTYSNKCMLSLANCNNRVADASSKAITVASEGECGAEADAATPTPKNETSGDADTSNATNATTAPPARDDADEPTRLCEMLCSMAYQPVCGSDGKTYSNACELRRAACKTRVALTQVSEGECAGADAQDPTTATPAASTATPAATTATPAATTASCRRSCPKIMKPVCGSNGFTYSNQCEFENAKCTIKIATGVMTFTDGECAAADAATNTTTSAPTPTPTTARKCSQMCTEMYAPVCGSDGKTYGNKCLFNVAKCKLGTASTLAVASDGECTAAAADADACPRACTQTIDPVCGSDGVTYNNKCEFEIAKCTKKIATGVMTFSEGACA